MGLTLGLTVRDIDDMTVGEVVDLAYYRANKHKEHEKAREDDRRKATQADYDAF